MVNAIHSIRVIDGDTVEAMVAGTEFFKNDYKLLSIRLYGIDTPEKNTVAGKLVKQVVIQVLSTYKEPLVQYRTEDKFSGRGVGDVEDGSQVDVVTLSEFLLLNRLAKRYYGDKKKPWTDQELYDVENNCNKLLPTYHAEHIVAKYQDNAEQYNQEEERLSIVYYSKGYVESTLIFDKFIHPTPENA
jgi:hypothetical protein